MRGIISGKLRLLRPIEGDPTMGVKLIVLWLIVGVPLAFGVEQTLEKAMVLFQ